VPEIQVFAIQLKTPELHRDVLRCIDSAVHFPIVFELTHGQGPEARTQIVAAYKRLSEVGSDKWVYSEYFESGWMPATAQRTPLPLALDLGRLYELILHRLVPMPVRPHESLSDLITRSEALMAKTLEIEKTKTRLSKERQFNRKVEINAKLRQLNEEYQNISR